MLIPLGKKILVQPIEEQKGSLLITNQKYNIFLVLAIGDEVTKVKIGSKIYLQNFQGLEITYEKEKYIFIEESAILARLD